ncbi:MAG: hypothetical protein AMDU4_FER2C00121G0001 [Ferroplasma sp. Type II]|uniref:hypothetical protein n=2 Tax=Ferroplasma sp. Type II TaxID=261388 RepID=UPI00038965BA|nr:hypothetical protein [Ferroplasma sp. Type II]EQB72904.1 MAG: hypothetical protein AMDU4_FER2C00121G0001 [Ferroplasma sp. Type II]
MTLKSHYKIIISIIIMIILVSSYIIVYDTIHEKHMIYYNDAKSIDLKYFNFSNREFTVSSTENDIYNSSSHSMNENQYLNSTIYYPQVRYLNSVRFNMNIHLKNINSKDVYVNLYTNCESTHVYNSTKSYWVGDYDYLHSIVPVNNNNSKISVRIDGLVNNNNYYNISVKVCASNNFYNLFSINTEKESAIYGSIINNTTGNTVKVNTTLYIENVNNSIINTINVRDGYYYYFVQPYTEYKLYSLNSTNNTLKLIDTISNKNITSGNSYHYRIFSGEL